MEIPTSTRIVIVNEEPFLDEEKREFERELERAGIRPSECIFVNIYKTRLGRDGIASKYINKSNTQPSEELLEHMEVVEKTIEKLNPNVVIGLGGFVLHLCTGLFGVGKWRGSIVKMTNGRKFVPTFHPSACVKDYSVRPIVLCDLRKAKAEAWFPQLSLPKRTLIIQPTLGQIEEYMQKVRDAKKCAVDIETQYMKGISCIAFSADKESAISIPLMQDGQEYWNPTNKQRVEALIRVVLLDETIEKYGQNFHYDWCYLARDGYVVNNYAFDTMQAQHAAWPEMPKSLAFLASIYTREPYWKDDGKDWKKIKDWQKYWGYNARDACVTRELVDALSNELTVTKNWDTFQFEMGLIPKFVRATLRGIKFDEDWRKELLKSKLKELQEIERNFPLPPNWKCAKCGGAGTTGKKKPIQCKVCGGSGKHINLNSPTQVKKLIYVEMKFPAIVKRTGKLSTDAETLIKLQVKYPHPIFETLLKQSRVQKEIEFLRVKIDADGRIRTTLSCNTETGRLSSSSSPFGTGTNLQNIKRSNEYRRLFRADEGMVFYAPDYAKAEAMVVAYESMDMEYIQIFEKGLDIHRINAQTIFEKENITDAERQLGKRIAHGLNYLMGTKTLCDYVLKEMGESYAITQAQAKKFSEAYFARFRGIKRWHHSILEELKATRTLTNCFGRKRVFLGRLEGGTHRIGVAFKPQSTVADLCDRAIGEVERKVPEVEWLLQVHDQLIFQGAEEANIEEVASRIKNAMEIPMQINGMEFKIPVDMKIGKSWGELH